MRPENSRTPILGERSYSFDIESQSTRTTKTIVGGLASQCPSYNLAEASELAIAFTGFREKCVCSLSLSRKTCSRVLSFSLKRVLTDWKSRVQGAGEEQKAHLLHSLTDVLKNSPGPTKFRRRKRMKMLVILALF